MWSLPLSDSWSDLSLMSDSGKRVGLISNDIVGRKFTAFWFNLLQHSFPSNICIYADSKLHKWFCKDCTWSSRFEAAMFVLELKKMSPFSVCLPDFSCCKVWIGNYSLLNCMYRWIVGGKIMWSYFYCRRPSSMQMSDYEMRRSQNVLLPLSNSMSLCTIAI